MSDVLTITDLEIAKKHDTFHSEVITGKAGGLASGADIDSATNAVTGQVQTTLPKVLRDVGFKPALFTFVTGGTLGVADADKCIYNPSPDGDNNWYSWGGVLPHTVAPGADPTAVGSGYMPRTDVVLRDELAQADSNVLVAGALASVVATASTSCVYAEDYPTFADAVATGKNVLYSGNHTISSTITLAAGQRVSKVGCGLLTFTGANAFTLSSGNVLEFCEFAGPNNVPALRANGGVKDIKIIHPVCNICPLLRTNNSLAYADADWVGKTNVVQNVTVINPIGYGDSAVGAGNTFMETHYIDGFTVIGGFCKNYYFGHYYWGGDSNFSADGGSRGNVRKCDNIELIGFTTVDCAYAGMWGSMAKKVKRTNCSVIRTSLGGDVGIDDEGTESAINVNCHSEGYANGNYAGFFGFSDIQMIGCTSRQYAGKPHYRNYNDSGDSSKSGDVLISGGSYSTIDPQNGFATMDTLNGPARSFRISGGASIENTLISLSTNGGFISVLDIEQLFTVSGSAAYVAISTYAASTKKIKISGPSIRTDATPFAGSIGVRATTANFNAAERVQVSDIDAPSLPIELKEAGGNAGVSGRFWCYDNVVSAITRNNAGAKPLTLVRGDNNYTPTGSAITV